MNKYDNINEFNAYMVKINKECSEILQMSKLFIERKRFYQKCVEYAELDLFENCYNA